MIASNVSKEVIQSAADAIGCPVDITALSGSGMRHRVKLNASEIRPDADPLDERIVDEGYPSHPDTYRAAERRLLKSDRKYQRMSANAFGADRRVAAVCWHGFRDFFRECFELAPEAVFRTALDKWDGSEDFEARFAASGHRNIGSQMFPTYVAAACRCGEEGYAG